MLRRLFALSLFFAFIAGCGSSENYLRKIPRDQRKGLLVLNCTNNTPKSRAAEFEPWEFGLASMVMTDLEAIGMFNIVSKERIKDVMKEHEFQMTGLVSTKDAVKLGELVGAQFILAGSFTEMNGSLRMESQVISVEKGSLQGTAAVNGKTDEFFDLEKDLVVKTSAFLGAMLNEQEQQKLGENVETKSFQASLSNYKGELAVEQAQELKKEGKTEEAKKVIAEAKQSFEQAIKIDPEYEKAKQNLSRISLAMPVTL